MERQIHSVVYRWSLASKHGSRSGECKSGACSCVRALSTVYKIWLISEGCLLK